MHSFLHRIQTSHGESCNWTHNDRFGNIATLINLDTKMSGMLATFIRRAAGPI